MTEFQELVKDAPKFASMERGELVAYAYGMYAAGTKTDAENAKLRELVRDMWFWGYEDHMSSESQEWQMKHIDGVLDRMRELGIEVGQ